MPCLLFLPCGLGALGWTAGLLRRSRPSCLDPSR